MTKQELSQIALKILGIFALLESVQLMSGFMNVFAFPEDILFNRYVLILSMILPLLVLVSAGIILIVRTEIIALKFFPTGPIENIDLKIDQIQAIAFSIIGVALIVTAIPKLAQLGMNIYGLMYRANELGVDFTLFTLERDTIGLGINLSIRFILGVLLFVSGDSLANLWRRIKDRVRYESNISL
jgi:hypothetical protein